MHGRNTNTLLGSKRFRGEVIAVRLFFTEITNKEQRTTAVINMTLGRIVIRKALAQKGTGPSKTSREKCF